MKSKHDGWTPEEQVQTPITDDIEAARDGEECSSAVSGSATWRERPSCGGWWWSHLEIPKRAILKRRARRAQINKQFADGFLRGARQPNRCAETISFNHARHDSGALFGAQLVHAFNMLRRLSIVKRDFDNLLRVCNNARVAAPSTPSSKIEFPPLLPVGLHPMSIAELQRLCVDAFAASKTRAGIFAGLCRVVQRLETSKIAGSLWIDGSFVTQKVDPTDVDILLQISDALYSTATSDQKKTIKWLNDNLKASERCDSYVYSACENPSHSLYAHSQFMLAYWMKQFGFSRRDQMKGIAVIELAGGATP